MAKRLCKYNRRDIADSLGTIHSLVTESKYVCRSCARSSADMGTLCKPSAIPPAICQSKSDKEKAGCGLLAETVTESNVDLADQEHKSFKVSVKKAKKALKKQKRYQKKLARILKKQKKLLNKQKSIEKQFANIASQTLSQASEAETQVQLH
ncbi:hypothetical protein [Vibrio sp. SCSIO 43137]|uniref:hypothetical protein n=1 Tax=Vibrio sp. SCSIO 43137 TaxID=3021011 RepID=UPI002306FBED|nr:hypothetical protein [Vibrio sp. SCSIO 43137]WCE29675.1 hypothetical protein PK654_15420 [Vibrio sp. SCSIO 43137]